MSGSGTNARLSGLTNEFRVLGPPVPGVPESPVPDAPGPPVPDAPGPPVSDAPGPPVPDVPGPPVPDPPGPPVLDVPELSVPEVPALPVPDVPELPVPDAPGPPVPGVTGLPHVPDVVWPDPAGAGPPAMAIRADAGPNRKVTKAKGLVPSIGRLEVVLNSNATVPVK